VGGSPVWSATKYVGLPNSLTVVLGDATPASTVVEPGTAGAPVLQFILLPAGANVTVTSVTLTASGTLDDASEVSSVSLHRDVNGNGRFEPGTDVPLGTPGTFTADDGTVTLSGLSRTIPAAGSEHWLAVVDLSAGAALGGTFRARIAAAGDVGVSGGPPAPTVFGPPIQGNPMIVGITGRIDVALGPNNPAAANVEAGSTGVELLHLSLTAGATEAIRVTGLAVKRTGSMAFFNGLVDLFLHADADGDGVFETGDTLLAGPAAILPGNGDTVGWNFDVTIPASGTATWFVVADFAPMISAGDTLGLALTDGAHVTATGCTTSNPVQVEGVPVVGEQMTVTAPPTAVENREDHHMGCGGHPGFAAPAGTASTALLFLAFALFASALRGRNAQRRA
jgi:hypothetical protein